MGKMALGYGSEFHLLRIMGRHRSKFDKRVKELLCVDNITWLDFDLDKKKDIPDKELVGLSFLGNEDGKYQKIINTWKNEWPQSGNSMNWDLVGFNLNKDNSKTWILVEAKAHIRELKQDCKAKKESNTKINNQLQNIKTKYNIVNVNDWTKNYYQFANRLYVIDLLKRHYLNAKLLNVYFIGDMIGKQRKSPKDKAEWEIEIKCMKNYMGIDTQFDDCVHELFLEIDEL